MSSRRKTPPERPRVDGRALAQRRALRGERIVEFIAKTPRGAHGGLISLRVAADGYLDVEVYALDEHVRVIAFPHLFAYPDPRSTPELSRKRSLRRHRRGTGARDLAATRMTRNTR